MSSTSESTTVTIVSVACTLGLLIMIVVGVFVRRLRNKQRAHDFVQQLDDMQREGFVEDYFHEDFLIQHNLVPQELNRKSLQKLEVVGSGQFGEVWKAVLYPHRSHKHLKDTEPLRVAAKVVNEDFQVCFAPQSLGFLYHKLTFEIFAKFPNCSTQKGHTSHEVNY